METTTETSVSKTKQEIIKEAKRVEETSLFSSKGHLVASRMWSNLHLGLGLVMTVMSASAASLALSAFDGKHVWAGLLFLASALISAVMTFLNANERAGVHFNAGNHYDSLMNRTRVFWTVECWGMLSDPELAAKLQALSGEKDRLNLGSPQIPYWAYKIAKRQIAAGEAVFAVDNKVQ